MGNSNDNISKLPTIDVTSDKKEDNMMTKLAPVEEEIIRTCSSTLYNKWNCSTYNLLSKCEYCERMYCENCLSRNIFYNLIGTFAEIVLKPSEKNGFNDVQKIEDICLNICMQCFYTTEINAENYSKIIRILFKKYDIDRLLGRTKIMDNIAKLFNIKDRITQFTYYIVWNDKEDIILFEDDCEEIVYKGSTI